MILKKLRFKNFKSYGNKTQEISFNDNGGLWLVYGTNGSGKSSLIEAIDLCIFNQVRGKKSTKIPLKDFPNRTNKNLEVEIEFKNSKGDNIDIVRKIAPNHFNIKVNNENFTERYKLMNELDKENLIGFNYQTFKSFISLSINDFLNFIQLKPEDKRNLLNRLFNMEEIDDYYSINKELINQNKKEKEKIVIDLTNIDKELKDYISIIKNSKSNKKDYTKEDLKSQIKDIKLKYNEKLTEIKNIENDISNFDVKLQEHRNHINSNENENVKRRTELIEIRSKIKIFDSGQCPYCNSDLDTDEHIKLLEELKIKEIEFTEKILQNESLINHYKDQNQSIGGQLSIINKGKQSLINELSNIKSDAKILKYKFDSFDKDNSDVVEELKKKGSILLKDKKEKLNRIVLIKKEIETLTELSKILGDKGARKSIIASLVPPINKTLTELLEKINFPYTVHLNNNFDAEIYDRGELINPETESTGEMKMVNICIAISYIKLVREIKNINILFMDEVFNSINKDFISLLLNLLKDFSIENKINLILMHHGLEDIDSKIFDKVLSVEKKNLFSDIIFN